MAGIPTAEHAVLMAMLLCLGAAVPLVWADRHRRLAGWISFAVVVLSAVLVLGAVIEVLRHGPGHGVTFLAVPQLGFALRLYVDGLSAAFLALIAVVAVCSGLHSIDYMVHHRPAGSGRFYPHLLVFIAAMYGLVCTTDMMWFFFIFWQMMTLTGWAMIRYERGKEAHRKAASRFLWMMQLACAVTMLGAAMLARDEFVLASGTILPRFDFDAVAHQMAGRFVEQPVWMAVALALFLTGFGIKLGMWPFGQFWLPDAHPAAPSPVSALLSGVMLKTGVYGLMRYFIWLTPPEARADYPAAMWGTALVILGTVTLLTGTFRALNQEESKRLLAYSSIGQAGYILFALGVCLVLLGSDHPAAAALAGVAFIGALFHTLNHGIFKSLLFLNAGSVLQATGTQDLNKLGGLLRFMPVTGITAFIGALALAGVPLLSGYASKWPMLVAAIQGAPVSRLLPLCAAVAILTSALTLALMIKFYGSVFLARTSGLVRRQAERPGGMEVTGRMRLAQGLLAGICVVIGLLPALGVSFVARALQVSQQGLAINLAIDPGLTAGLGSGLAPLSGAATYAPVILFGVGAALFALVHGLSRLGGAVRRPAAPWLCGYALETDANRVRAVHYYTELHRAVNRLHPAAAGAAGAKAAPKKPQEETATAWSLEKNSIC